VYLTKDLIIHIILSLAFGMALLASAVVRAYEINPVNTHIKEENVKIEAQERRAEIEYKNEQETLYPAARRLPPLHERDNLFDDLTPENSGENLAAIEMPRGVVRKAVDPLQAIEQKIIDKQMYDLYRDRYRRAVHNEFVRKLKRDGLKTHRNIAEEIKRLELGPDAY
jgi:hypothetical protein